MSTRHSNFLASLALAVVNFPAFGGIIYVDADATGSTNDGSSWCSAFLELQDALAASAPGDSILVADGAYRPDQGGGQTPGDRLASFALILGVELYGGFAGCGASDPNENDVDIFETILSGDLAENDGPNYANNGENALHVLTGDATDSSTVVDGFTVVGGNANANDLPNDAGGGMRIHAGSPTIHNCVFTGNSATFGGAMENFNGGNPTISACLFVANRATFRGGGMHNNTSSPMLSDTVFLENVATNSGGGMRSWNFSAPILTRCEFVGNHAGFGGGMVNDEAFATLRDCIFRANTADDTSGGMHNWISNPDLVNCLFVDNEAMTKGGGIYSLNTSTPTLTNCTLSGNLAGAEGGGLFATGSSGGLLVNCIVWGNISGALGGPGTFAVTFSDIEGGFTGAGNIDIDPFFVDAAAGNLRLGVGSPCIDAADNTAVPPGVATDLDGTGRIVDDPCTTDTGEPGDLDAIVDMGAYEHHENECCDDSHCDDEFFCNGLETCVMGTCEPGTPVDGDDGIGCTVDSCDEDIDAVVNSPDDSLCDNGLFCDGMESCSSISGCQPGDEPCTAQLCNEGLAACVDCLTGADCSDGDPCNGAETCGAGGVCLPGAVTDCNENGIADSCDIDDGTSTDDDGDGIPDECQAVAIPAISDWGLVVLALLLLTVRKVMRNRIGPAL